MVTKLDCEEKIIKQLREANDDDFIQMFYILGIAGVPQRKTTELIRKAGKNG